MTRPSFFKDINEPIVWIAISMLMLFGGIAAIAAKPVLPVVIAATSMLLGLVYILYRKISSRAEWIAQFEALAIGFYVAQKIPVNTAWVLAIYLGAKTELETRGLKSPKNLYLIISERVVARDGKRYMGLAEGDAVSVAWDESRNPGYDGLRSIIRHEMAHVFLGCSGWPNGTQPDIDAQHAWMRENGFL